MIKRNTTATTKTNQISNVSRKEITPVQFTIGHNRKSRKNSRNKRKEKSVFSL